MVPSSHAADATALLAEAAAAGVVVTVRGGVLAVRGPRGATALMRAVGARKAEVLRALAGAEQLLPPNAPPPDPGPPRAEPEPRPTSPAGAPAGLSDDELVARIRAAVADDWREHLEGTLAEALGRPDPARRQHRLRQLLDFVLAFARRTGSGA